MMNEQQLNELILQALEHEQGGVKVYETAIECAQNSDLHEEWEKYLGETRMHVETLTNLATAFGLDPDQETPGRKIVRMLGASLVEAMRSALGAGKPEAAQLLACECVVLAETKDHLNWELLGKCAEKGKSMKLSAARVQALSDAVEKVEDQEDEHLYHTKGWCRELWIQSLGMRAVLPPLEEQRDVKTAIGAARAEQASEKSR
jgi:hypothetical protein